MIGYNDLYEILRKEKYSESLQELPKKFLEEYKEYLEEQNQPASDQTTPFSNSIPISRKQLENSIVMFRELILKRKRKILNLIFVATETGIMKRDYENMLPIEKSAFEKMVKSFEDADSELSKILSSKTQNKKENKMILFKQNIEQFLDHEGKIIGPFKSGDLANLNSEVAQIFVGEKKASFVDDN